MRNLFYISRCLFLKHFSGDCTVSYRTAFSSTVPRINHIEGLCGAQIVLALFLRLRCIYL